MNSGSYGWTVACHCSFYLPRSLHIVCTLGCKQLEPKAAKAAYLSLTKSTGLAFLVCKNLMVTTVKVCCTLIITHIRHECLRQSERVLHANCHTEAPVCMHVQRRKTAAKDAYKLTLRCLSTFDESTPQVMECQCLCLSTPHKVGAGRSLFCSATIVGAPQPDNFLKTLCTRVHAVWCSVWLKHDGWRISYLRTCRY